MSIVELIQRRRSVRTYSQQPIEESKLTILEDYIENLNSPLFRFSMYQLKKANGKRQGAYGVIKGANQYIVGAIKKDEYTRADIAVEFGYFFEKIVLEATRLGLGTCWIGGTYKPEDFSDAEGITDDYQIVMVTPIGYEQDKRFLDRVIRLATKANNRKPFDTLFGEEALGKRISQTLEKYYREALEMVRLAPSARNLQPWRIIRRSGCYDFYMPASEANNHWNGYLMTYNDIGIATLHFEKTLEEYGIYGKWFREEDRESVGLVYVCSWREES